jgi:hypothetical protein
MNSERHNLREDQYTEVESAHQDTTEMQQEESVSNDIENFTTTYRVMKIFAKK